MPKNGPRAAPISEWEKRGVDSSSIASGRSGHTNSKRKRARRLSTSGIPAVSAEPRIGKVLLLYRGEKSVKPHRKNSTKLAKVSPIYKEAEKKENVREKIHFSLVSKRYIRALQILADGVCRLSQSRVIACHTCAGITWEVAMAGLTYPSACANAVRGLLLAVPCLG